MKPVSAHDRMPLTPLLRIVLMAALLATLAGQAGAEISRAREEYLFGPDTAPNDACSLALGKARARALANVLGESISAEQLMSCKGSTGKFADYGCELNQITWSQIDGDIRKTLSERTTVEQREGASACIADVEVDVVIPVRRPDPDFQLRADLGHTVFRVGDEFDLQIELSQPGYFAVFNWLPHDSNAVIRVLPDGDAGGQSSLYLGAEKKGLPRASFGMIASWTDSYTGRRKFYDEYLIVVATRQPQRWLSKYDLDEFKQALLQVPNDQKRVVKKAYQLFRR